MTVTMTVTMPMTVTVTMYFLQGTRAWRFNSNLQLMSGYPKTISAEFGIPRISPDAVFVWGRNGKLYLFRGKYDREKRGDEDRRQNELNNRENNEMKCYRNERQIDK